jgi:hypothetical protein
MNFSALSIKTRSRRSCCLHCCRWPASWPTRPIRCRISRTSNCPSSPSPPRWTARAAQLETEVSRKIEDSVATLQGVKNIYTTVLDGVSTTTVEFILEKNISDAVNDVRDAVARVKADMPAELRDPTVTKATTAGRVVLTFTAAAQGPAKIDAQELSWFVDNTVAKRLLAVPAWAPSSAWAASTAKSAWSWTTPAWRRCACPRWTSRASCAWCRRKRRADGATSAAPSSRCAPSPP